MLSIVALLASRKKWCRDQPKVWGAVRRDVGSAKFLFGRLGRWLMHASSLMVFHSSRVRYGLIAREGTLHAELQPGLYCLMMTSIDGPVQPAEPLFVSLPKCRRSVAVMQEAYDTPRRLGGKRSH